MGSGVIFGCCLILKPRWAYGFDPHYCPGIAAMRDLDHMAGWCGETNRQEMAHCGRAPQRPYESLVASIRGADVQILVVLDLCKMMQDDARQCKTMQDDAR